MDLQHRKWVVCPRIPDATLATVPEIPPLLAQLLYNRGILNGDASLNRDVLAQFLQPRWDGGLHDPFLMADMGRAVERILAAVERRECIGVFGHYDADGITALVLMTSVLKRLGARVVPYMPRRSDDYGVNDNGIAELAAQGVTLLISVDCGIRSFLAPETAARHGMDVIITDHHTVLQGDAGDELPAAFAVLNPMRADCPYPCKSLAGVGVAFKLAQALLRAHAQRTGEPETHYAKWLLDLVCLGTVGDVSDITGENRTLVTLGLEILKRSKRPGVQALLCVAGTNVSKLNVETVGFQLAPRINAAARMEDPWLSVSLLLTTDPAEAMSTARQLNTLNNKRQEITNQAMAEIEKRYGETLLEHNAIVVDGSWPAGIIGLIAGKLREAYSRPAAVIEISNEEEAHGSARSCPGFHISDALRDCADLLSRYGGHAQAAGFALPRQNVDAFRVRLQTLADERLRPEELVPVLAIDALLDPSEITLDLLRVIQQLEPCGPGTPSPLFGMRGVRVASAETFGTTGDHLRLMLRAPDRTLRATGWRMGLLAEQFPPGAAVDIAFALKEDSYVGLALDIQDVAAAGER